MNNKFEILDTGSYFIKPFTHYQMQKIIDINLLPKKFLEGLYGMISYIPDLGSEIYVNVKKVKDNYIGNPQNIQRTIVVVSECVPPILFWLNQNWKLCLNLCLAFRSISVELNS